MKKKTLLTIAALMLLVGSLYAHDMYLKLSTYFLSPHIDATIALFNGTFDKSENVITRDRMQDVRIVGPGSEAVHPDTSQWWEKDNITWLDFETGDPGTYVIGVSTRPRMIDLSAEEFNAYLEHDGVLDVLEARKREGTLDKEAREKYSKHVKAIYQVGDTRTEAYRHRLGYPIEIVPLNNPYELGVGDACEVLVLKDGQPVANQLIYASYEGYHNPDNEGGHVEAIRTRTDGEGVA
ncbi:MAG: DUF4198 domain-containing protein, partial [Rhodothermales bacterium]